VKPGPAPPFEPTGLAPTARSALRDFERLLRERALPLGLVAPDDVDRIWERHVLDSLRAGPCLPEGSIEVVDIGSGAGLPGIPLAIVRPDARFILLEPKRRRAAFLELAVERLLLANVTVVDAVAGSARAATWRAHVCTLRAVASPVGAWRMAVPLLREAGVVVYFAGRSWGAGDRAALAGEGVDTGECAGPSLDGGGPVVIMRRRPRS
jgi:16S rRNA (guanine527-N7)-methyltransferase